MRFHYAERKLSFEDGPLPLDFPKLERITELTPAYDRRSPDPNRNYGIHGVDLWFWLKGPEGAVQFHLMTNWWPLSIQNEKRSGFDARKFKVGTSVAAKMVTHMRYRGDDADKALERVLKHQEEMAKQGVSTSEEITECVDTSAHSYPMPADLGYHSRTPKYENHKPMGTTKTYWREATEEERAVMPSLKKVPDVFDTDTFSHCELTDGEPCFYDGSGLNAERIYAILLEEGSDGVWEALGRYYYAIFRSE